MPRMTDWEISDDCATPEELLRENGFGAFAHLVEDFQLEDIGPEQLGRLHRELRKSALMQADKAFGLLLVWILSATNLDPLACQAHRETDHKARTNKGLKTVHVSLPSGIEVPLRVTYFVEKKKRKAGRPKRHGNRGAEGTGICPALEVLGFDTHRKLSPLIEEAILRTGTACDDFRTGFEMAQHFGFEMSWKAYGSRFRRLALDIRTRHDDRLFSQTGPALFEAERWRGKRVVISVDGGRCRLREDHLGAPKKNGWRDFDADWREPKLFVIYAINDDGEALCEPEPIIDGTFGDADVFFERLEATLTQLEIWNASEVAFLGDGAPWIWNRARPMLEGLGVEKDTIVEGIDFFHAFSALSKLSDLPDSSDWGSSQQIRWRIKARKTLKDGDIEKIGDMIEDISKYNGAAKALDKKAYFSENEARMQYQERRAANLPEGSGAIESGIRRVVNLRMKGNGKFWKEVNAEAMLTVRSHLKTRRFDRLMDWWQNARSYGWSACDRRRLRLSHRRYSAEIAPQETRQAA